MQYGDILGLPWGKGHSMVASIFNEVIIKLEKHAPKMILLAHSTYSSTQKDGEEITTIDIQLGKKSKFNATFKADAIGFMYRTDNKNYINFSANKNDAVAGTRHRYLTKEDILISEFEEDDKGNETFHTYWEKIFAPKEKEESKK